MVRSRPSSRSGIRSSLATSSRSAATRRRSSKPFSGRRISRIRNMMVTLTCLPCSRNLRARFGLGIEIVDVDVGAVLDLFDVDLGLLLFGLARFLFLLEAEPPVIHDLADDGTRGGGDFHQIQTLLGHFQSLIDGQNAYLFTISADQADRRKPDSFIDAHLGCFRIVSERELADDLPPLSSVVLIADRNPARLNSQYIKKTSIGRNHLTSRITPPVWRRTSTTRRWRRNRRRAGIHGEIPANASGI